MKTKMVVYRWFQENKIRMIIFVGLILITFIPIIATGQTVLKFVRTEQVALSDTFQYNPIAIYENGKRHLFWIERDQNYNYSIKTEFNNIITTLTDNYINYTHEMNAFFSNNILYLLWSNNDGFFYANRTDSTWNQPYKFGSTLHYYNLKRETCIDNYHNFHFVTGRYSQIYYRNYSTTSDTWSDSFVINNTLLGEEYYYHENPTINVNDNKQVLISWQSSSKDWKEESNTIWTCTLSNGQNPKFAKITSEYMKYAHSSNILLNNEGTFEVFWYESYSHRTGVSLRAYEIVTDSWSKTLSLVNITYPHEGNENFIYIQTEDNSNIFTIIWQRNLGNYYFEYWSAEVKNHNTKYSNVIYKFIYPSFDLFWCYNYKDKVEFYDTNSYYDIEMNSVSDIVQGSMRITYIMPLSNDFAILAYIVLGLFFIDLSTELFRYMGNERKFEKGLAREVQVVLVHPNDSRIQKVKDMWEIIKQDNLETLLQCEESEYFDRKEKFSHDKKSRLKLEKHLVAMANTFGGILAFGVTDSNEIKPLKAKTVDTLEHYISDIAKKIQGPVVYDHHPIKYEGKSDELILCIYIPKYKGNPHRTSYGRYYWRVGRNSIDIPPKYIILSFGEQ